MPQYLRVKNWEEFQHYKDRNPPWIKLHRSLLNNYEFQCLQDASKAHLMGIWLLASQLDNKVPADPEWIGQRIAATTPVDLTALIDNGFLLLDGCEQSASKPQAKRSPETETETETEEDKEAARKRARFVPPKVEEVAAYCRERKNGINPQAFVDHYEANGWKRGKTPIKNWQACVRTWEQNNPKPASATPRLLTDA